MYSFTALANTFERGIFCFCTFLTFSSDQKGLHNTVVIAAASYATLIREFYAFSIHFCNIHADTAIPGSELIKPLQIPEFLKSFETASFLIWLRLGITDKS